MSAYVDSSATSAAAESVPAMIDRHDEFNAALKAEYGVFYERYPNAMMLFDLALRNRLAGRRQSYEEKVDKLVRFSPQRWLYSCLMRGVLRVLSFRPPVEKAVWLGELKRFPYLKKAASEAASGLGYRVLANGRGGLQAGGSRPRRFLLHNIPLNTWPIKRRLKGFDKHSPELFFADAKNMGALEELVAAEVQRTVNWLRVLNIKHIIEGEDQPPSRQLLAKASKLAGVKYHVFVHGYIQGPFAISILPLRGDALYMWSASQVRCVERYFSPEERLRVVNFGYPVIDARGLECMSPAAPTAKKRMLYVASPLSAGSGVEAKQAIFKRIADACAALELDLVVRLHPKDRGDKAIQRLLKAVGTIDSRRAPLRDLLDSDIVIGDNSSMLFEAAALGKPALQIAELKQFDFDGVEVVPSERLREVVKRCLGAPPTVGASLVPDFRAKIQAILG